MEVVIDISDEDYNAIRDNIKAYSLADILFGAVQCGTVLPKGHGDLIDRGAITVEEDVYFQNYIIHAPTVIPADK